jgi:hypothetical protein
MKTSTPKLDPAVLSRLRDYVAHFAPDFPQSKPARCVASAKPSFSPATSPWRRQTLSLLAIGQPT